MRDLQTCPQCLCCSLGSTSKPGPCVGGCTVHGKHEEVDEVDILSTALLEIRDSLGYEPGDEVWEVANTALKAIGD